MVEVEHVDIDKLDLPEPPKNQYRIRHVALATPDIDRAVKFYSKLLQEPKPRRLGRFWKLSGEKLDKVSGLPDSKIEMAFFQVRNMELEIAQYHSHPTQRPADPRPLDALGYNMIVFDVEDLAKARDHVVASGGDMVGEYEGLYDHKILFARDPDGNLIGFQTAPETSVISSQNFKDNGI